MKGIRVVTTYSCNIMCSHCRYKCSPMKKGAMDIKFFNNEVEKALEEGYGDYIIIEGGEVLLRSGALFRYLKNLQSFEGDKYLVTNGFWGGIDPYIDILRDLKLKGLKGIIIEYDYFHSVFIEVDRIELAIKKCLVNDITVKIRATFLSGSMECQEDRRTYEIIKELRNKFNQLEVVFEVTSRDDEFVMPTRRNNNEKVILY